MRPAQITAKVRRMLGACGYWRQNDRAPDRAEREAAKAAIKETRAALDAAQKARDDKRRELLDVPEYRALVAAVQVADKAHHAKLARSYGARVEIGIKYGIGTRPLAEGDTYAEAFAALQQRIDAGDHLR